MKSKEPLVSIVIPTYNSEKTLAKCLESIKNQTYKNIEVIVVDKFSKDRTVEIAKRFGAKVFVEMLNKPEARNYGILKSKGKYVILADADFVFENSLVEEVVKIFEEKRVDALFIDEVYYGKSFWRNCRNLEKMLYSGNELIESPRAYKKEIFKKILFDEKNEGPDEYDFYFSAKKFGIRCERIKSKIMVLESPFNIKKKFRHGEFFKYFQHKHEKIAKIQTNPKYRLSILLKAFREDPLHAIGLFFLKSIEYLAFKFGIFYSRFDRKILRIIYKFNSNESGITYEKKMFDGEGGRFVDIIERRFVLSLVNSFKLKNAKVLDVGAGGGRFSREFLKLGFDVTALDSSKTAYEDLKKIKGIKVINEDCERVNFKENQFDLIFAWRSFKYVNNKEKALYNFRKWLKEDGILIVEMPNLFNPFYFLSYVFSPIIFNLSKGRYGSYFIFSDYVSKRRFKKILEEVGFKVIDVKNLFSFPHTFYQKLNSKLILNIIYQIDRILKIVFPRSLVFIASAGGKEK
jgi:glycosyltransferase involved in cell wall biosynthesis